MDDDINAKVSTPNKNNNNMIYFHFPIRPTAVRPQKRVQFPTRIPTIREISKGITIPPPGCTPISSSTNICATQVDVVTTKSQNPVPKLIHSSTSLEVEFDEEVTSSIASPSVSTVETITPSGSQIFTTSPYEGYGQFSSQEQLYQQPRCNSLKKRGSSIPAKMKITTASTTYPEDVESFVNDSNNNDIVKISTPRGERSTSFPRKSILRKPTIKEMNSNMAAKSANASTTTLMSTAAASIYEEDDNGNIRVKKEWENTGVSCTPIAATSANLSRHGKSRCEFMAPRTRTTSSSSGTSFTQWQKEFAARKKPVSVSNSAIILPPVMNGSRVRHNVPLPQLTKVCAELRQKGVIFDRAAAIHGLKKRIMKGEKVSYDEIKAIRNMTLPPHQRHLGYRLPWSKDLFCEKGLVHIPTPNKPTPKTNTFGTMEDLRIPVNNEVTMEHYGRRHYVVNLAGFEDQHISLYLEGKNRLVLRAERHDGLDESEDMPMTVTETILLPPDLSADNLRIVRKPSGTTIIEESWRF